MVAAEGRPEDEEQISDEEEGNGEGRLAEGGTLDAVGSSGGGGKAVEGRKRWQKKDKSVEAVQESEEETKRGEDGGEGRSEGREVKVERLEHEEQEDEEGEEEGEKEDEGGEVEEEDEEGERARSCMGKRVR